MQCTCTIRVLVCISVAADVDQGMSVGVAYMAHGSQLGSSPGIVSFLGTVIFSEFQW